MSALRPVLCVALAASLAAAGAAGAATKPKPKPVCNLIVDASGDVAFPDDSLDIVGGDIASNAKVITVIVRVKNLAAQAPSTVTGKRIGFTFSIPGAEFPMYMSYSASPLGTYYDWGYLDTSQTPPMIEQQGEAVGSLNPAKNEVRITAPVSGFKGFGKATPGAKFTDITANAEEIFGVPQNDQGTYGYVTSNMDDATSSKSYVAGSQSCVKPGP